MTSSPVLLQDRLASLLPAGDVARVLAGAVAGGLQMDRRALTLLQVEPAFPMDAESRSEVMRGLRGLAHCHNGIADAAEESSGVFRFLNPRSALRMALAVLQMGPETRFRIGIATGLHTLASFTADGRHWSLVVGPEAQQAMQMAHSAVEGTVAMAAETCRVLGAELDEEVGAGLISLEFDGEDVSQATVTLPPRPNDYMSTFAGLGR